MAYYRRQSTPASRRTSAILMVIIALITLFIGLAERKEYQKVTSRCTTYEVGSVTDVDTQRVYRRRGGSYTKYKAEVTLIDGNRLGRKTVYTDWTRHAFYRGNAVRVFYDPNDPSLYYVDGAGPDDGVAMLITSGIIFAIGAVYYIKVRRES